MLTDLDYELLSAYIDGALTDSERTAFELRLQAEPELSHELDELRATVTLLNNLPARKAPRDFTLDARYARRSSYFFTSATFSALSTAAAVILFALGAYVLTVNKTPLPATSSVQVGQVASMPTTTGTVLDKAAAKTPTEPVQNELLLTTETPLNSPVVPPDGAITNDGIVQATQAVQPSSLPAQPPLIQADAAQATELMSEAGDTSGSAAASAPSDLQQRTSEATQTGTNEQYAAPMTITGAIGGAPAPSAAQETDATEAEANSSMAFAATQLPLTATALQTATATLTASPTLTLSPTLTPSLTLTLSPTVTASPTLTPSATLTETVTPQPTSAPLAVQSVDTAPDSLPLILVVLGVVFLLIAVLTTIIRRRNRL